jgi:hypothetical protein
VEGLPKWDPSRTKFARMLRSIREAGGVVRHGTNMGRAVASFGGSVRSGVWFRWNPAQLRIVDMLEETVHWNQLQSELLEAGYSRETLEIMAKQSIMDTYDIGTGLRLELKHDMGRVRRGTYFTND